MKKLKLLVWVVLINIVAVSGWAECDLYSGQQDNVDFDCDNQEAGTKGGGTSQGPIQGPAVDPMPSQGSGTSQGSSSAANPTPSLDGGAAPRQGSNDLSKEEWEEFQKNLKSDAASIDNDPEIIKCQEAAVDSNKKCNLIPPAVEILLAISIDSAGQALGSSSVESSCKAAETLNSLGAGANSVLGITCGTYSGSCKSTCGTIADVAKSQADGAKTALKECAALAKTPYSGLAPAQMGAASDCVRLQRQYTINMAKYRRATELWGKCENDQQKMYGYIAQAAHDAVKIYGALDCLGKVKDNKNLRNQNNNGDPCADPLKRAHPECICRDPVVAQKDSRCQGYRSGGGGYAGPSPSGVPTGSGSGLRNPLDGTNSPKGKVGADGPGTPTQNLGVAGGGGGGGGPQGSGSSTLNPEEQPSQPAPYNTNIEEGPQRAKGGDLFSNNFGGGYKPSSGESNGNKDFSFDLSKYLPQFNKNPSRTIAELDKLKAEGVTAASGPSIWEKISNRMRAIRGRLQ